MTFTEAAVEVLRLIGKPLHYKAITDIAIERELLSHLGKSPEITMNSRLATMVKKDRGDAPIIKVKPGVFGLREFDAAVIDAAMHESGQDFELPEPEVIEEDDEQEVDLEEGDTEGENGEAKAEPVKARAPEAPRPPAKKLPGQDVFPEEEDDDEPILANLDSSTAGAEGDADSRTSTGRPASPPWALNWSKNSFTPWCIWMPSCAAGPVVGADWPSSSGRSWARAGRPIEATRLAR